MINRDVLFRRVEDELVLVKIATNEIFALNPTGARIWELIGEGRDVEGVVDGLRDEYDQPADALRSKVTAFVAELRRQGFLD